MNESRPHSLYKRHKSSLPLLPSQSIRILLRHLQQTLPAPPQATYQSTPSTDSNNPPNPQVRRSQRPRNMPQFLQNPQGNQPINLPLNIPPPPSPNPIHDLINSRAIPKTLPPLIHNQKYLPLRWRHTNLQNIPTTVTGDPKQQGGPFPYPSLKTISQKFISPPLLN
jgi:hypothetical protein